MTQQFLRFTLDGEWYLHDISTVLEVSPYAPLNPFPGGPHQCQGIVDFRGSVITVFSGRALLSLPEASDPTSQKIVVFETQRGKFGVLVDDVNDIVAIDRSEIEKSADLQSDGLIQGTVSRPDQLLILVDFMRSEDLIFAD